MKKTISPAAINTLKEALTHIYWYKLNLKSFITTALGAKNTLLSTLNWDDYKRNIVYSLVDSMVRQENKYQADLLDLMHAVINLTDFSHLARLDDGKNKEKIAKDCVRALKEQWDSHEPLREELEAIEKRRGNAKVAIQNKLGVQEKLLDLNQQYRELIGSKDAQKRGFILERLLRDVFELFDLDPKAAFKITGEQIDGAFTFDSDDYILEAKWQSETVNNSDLDSFEAKVGRKRDNTLGLFISINGFAQTACDTHSNTGSKMILFDGQDLMAVLEDRISLPDILKRKRRYASQMGEVFISVSNILVS